MPFNGSGTFTILNQFIPGTTILASPMNDNLNDIASGLSDCLTRDNQAPMTGQFRAASGTLGAPGISFAADTNTGIALLGPNLMALVAGGNQVAQVDDLGFRMNEAISEDGAISPSSISTNQNNYAPTGIQTASILRLTASGAVNITGLAGTDTVTAPTAGRIIKLLNIGSNAITLVANSGSSTAANRFGFPSNFVLFPGQFCEMWYDGTASLWRMLSSFQFTSSAIQSCGRFQISSTTVVAFVPFNGNLITFPSGVVATIPSGGFTSTFNNASINGTSGQTLSNTTLYYAYLWDSTGVGGYVIDWSTTGHATDTSTGIEIKSGDATRVLIGMAYLVGANFLDSGANRLIASWLNRQPTFGFSAFTQDRTTASATFAEVNSEIRVNFISWNIGCDCTYTGTAGNSSGTYQSAISIDSTSGTSGIIISFFSNISAGASVPNGLSTDFLPSEGFHTLTVLSARPAGTTTYYATGLTNSSILSVRLVK